MDVSLRVIDPASNTDRVADVLIVDGRVAGVAPNLASPKAEVFDATGMIVAPGFIDMHVHLREPGFEHAPRPSRAARHRDQLPARAQTAVAISRYGSGRGCR